MTKVSRSYRFLLFFISSLLFASGLPRTAGAESEKSLLRLKYMIENIVRTSPGEIGVAIKHLESGRNIAIHGDTFFPMASVIKIPIFVEVISQVKEGKLKFEDEISLSPDNQFYEGGLLSDLKAPGIRLSLENLINMMMILSDNTATDVLLDKVGIPNVNLRLHSFGIKNILVSRTIRQLLIDYWGMDFAKYQRFSRNDFAEAYNKFIEENPQAFLEASKKYSQIMKDQATPLAVNRLLEMIFNKEILDSQSCEYILTTMLKCQTGVKRIRGLLPEETLLAHKTGTVGGTVNDCGIIYLPDNLGHVALSILSKDTDPRDTETMIAVIAKCVYDYFNFVL